MSATIHISLPEDTCAPWRLEARVAAQAQLLSANFHGTLLALSSPSGFVTLLSTLSGREARRLTCTRMSRPSALSFSASGASLLLTAKDGRVQLVAATHNEVLTHIRARSGIVDACMHPRREAACVLVPSTLPPVLGELDEGSLHTLVQAQQAPFECSVATCCAYSPDGAAVILGSPDGKVGALDSDLGELWCVRHASTNSLGSAVTHLRTDATHHLLLALCADGTITCFRGCAHAPLQHDSLTHLFTTFVDDGYGSQIALSSACFALHGSFICATEHVPVDQGYTKKAKKFAVRNCRAAADHRDDVAVGNKRAPPAGNAAEQDESEDDEDESQYEFTNSSTLFIFSTYDGSLQRVNEGCVTDGPGIATAWLDFPRSIVCLTRSGELNVWTLPKYERWEAFDPSFEYLYENRLATYTSVKSLSSLRSGIDVADNVNEQQFEERSLCISDDEGTVSMIHSRKERVQRPKSRHRDQKDAAEHGNSQGGSHEAGSTHNVAERSADEPEEHILHLPIHQAVLTRNKKQPDEPPPESQQHANGR